VLTTLADVSENGDSQSNGVVPGDGGVPRLTVGQRILAALPNLQRRPTTSPGPSPRRPASKSASRATGDDAGAVVTPDEVLEPGTGPSSAGGRIRDAFLKPPAARQPRGTPSGLSKEELTQIIKKIDDREQVLAYATAGLGVIVGVVLTIAAVHFDPPLHAKDHESTGFIIFFEGGARVLLSAIVLLATWNRRRSFVAFALLFLGTSMGFPFALPFWALGVWMIFRVLKWQKELAALTGNSQRTRTAPATRGRDAAEARRRARADRMSARATGGRRAKKQPEPTGPSKNKRYTPPNQIRPRPPGT
jgi:hypothetical protein